MKLNWKLEISVIRGLQSEKGEEIPFKDDKHLDDTLPSLQLMPKTV